jgi:hypothetical protein
MLMKLTPGYLFDDTIFICCICDIFLYCQFLTLVIFLMAALFNLHLSSYAYFSIQG